MANDPRVLLVEDDDSLRATLREWLESEGFSVLEAPTGHDALGASLPELDAVVLDCGLPDINGFEVLRRFSATAPRLPVIVLTGSGSIDHAVEAMKHGAFHYATKPADYEDVTRLLRSALVARGTHEEQGRSEVTDGDALEALVGDSRSMRRARTLIRKLAAAASATVLITGESGTGKDLAARALHAVSPRGDRPFVNVTCTALPSALLESELFGHERGAFTGAHARHKGLLERAEGGTLFLDEIGDMDPLLQAKLLRVLEEKRYRRVGGTEDLDANLRIVAATNVDLLAAVDAGRFRQDLYYRLAVLVLPMPPLRERRDDIPELARRLVGQHASRSGGRAPIITPAALAALVAHDWPGNVRELRNVLERGLVLREGNAIDVDDLELVRAAASETDAFLLPSGGVDIQQVEQDLVLQALERTQGNVTRAARLLGMSRDQVRYRIQKLSSAAKQEQRI